MDTSIRPEPTRMLGSHLNASIPIALDVHASTTIEAKCAEQHDSLKIQTSDLSMGIQHQVGEATRGAEYKLGTVMGIPSICSLHVQRYVSNHDSGSTTTQMHTQIISKSVPA